MKTITIDPISRLEGHGKIIIFLNDEQKVEKALFQVPELRGFEAFVKGRPAEDMPQITSRICGVCPTAHHMAATKALDDLFKVEPTPTAKAIRELVYSAFMVEDHALHFYFLGGPDFIVGPTAPTPQRNILGVVGIVGKEAAGQVIEIRRRLRELMALCGGKAIHPVMGLPGGVAKGVPEEERENIGRLGTDTVQFAQKTLDLFHKVVLGNKDYVNLITSDTYFHETNYMGLVDEDNKVNLYDGKIRVVGPDGAEGEKFDVQDYAEHIGEHVEDWTYIKFPFLRRLGWKGFVDGPDSGLYRVASLARLNVSDGMATPLAHAEFERMYDTIGMKPAHHTLVNHWARLIELLYAAERLVEISGSEELYLSDEIRNMDLSKPVEGIGVVEAPRGTLIHHYNSDERGVITACNLIVATVHNSAAMCMSIEAAAKDVIKDGMVDEGLLNRVEMAFRAYDPCLSCATHALPGKMPLSVEIVDSNGNLVDRVERG